MMYHSVGDSGTYFGKNPAEMQKLMEATGCGFVLDFSHAQSSSLSFKRNFTNVLDEYLRLNPIMFHLSDGMTGQARDMHLPLGKGTFNLKQLCSFIGERPVTLEVSPPTFENFKSSKELIRSFGY
jgi:endonuclease IV